MGRYLPNGYVKFATFMLGTLSISASRADTPTVVLKNENFAQIEVEVRTGLDQSRLDQATDQGTRVLSRGQSWAVSCNQGEFVMYRSHEPSYGWGEWIGSLCTPGISSYRLSDGGTIS